MPIVATSSNPPVPSTDSQTADGRLRATVMPDSAGVFLRADFSDALPLIGYVWPNPFQVTIYKQTEDGTISTVRGAADIAQYGGVFHAYDDEVTFGSIVQYWAVAPQADGEDGILTDRVAVVTWEPDGGFVQPGVWIKNLEDPELSCPARCQDWSAFTYGARNAVADIWGSQYPGVVSDVRKAPSTQLTVLTATEEEYQALLAATSGSVVYIVGLVRHRRRTGYYVLGDVASARIANDPATGYDVWTIPAQTIDNPVSAGQSLTVPGRSYADRQAAYPTFADVLATGRAYGAGTEPY
jgi:hypothetical protein